MDRANTEIIPPARKTGLVVKSQGEEVLVYDTENHKAHCLNRNAALIWEHCDGQKTIKDLSNLLQANGDSTKADSRESETLVWMALDQLEKTNLLEGQLARSSGASRLTRRQLIKAAGIAALIAVPVVSTIVAPTAAQASTCLASGQPCGTSAECCSGLCSALTCA